MTLSLGTAYRSFGGEMEASSTPMICRLLDSCRHQLSAIARYMLGNAFFDALLRSPIRYSRDRRHVRLVVDLSFDRAAPPGRPGNGGLGAADNAEGIVPLGREHRSFNGHGGSLE